MEHCKAQGAKLATSAAALAAISTGCSATGNSVTPPSRHVDANTVVAAYGNSESELAQVIADAKAEGKTARFVTVANQSVSHIFPPTAIMTKTDNILIVHSYGRTYVWPLANVKLSYSGSGEVDLSALPVVSAPITDKTVREIMAWTRHTAGLTNRSAACPDCFVVAPATYRSPPSAKVDRPRDPWQISPDYETWTDPHLTDGARPGTSVAHKMVQSRHHSDMYSVCGDGYHGWGSCRTYYLSPGDGWFDAFNENDTPAPGAVTNSIFITLGISSAGSEGITIPGAGHLYVQEWLGQWPSMIPVDTILQAGNVNGKVQFANFSQNPQSDWQSFLLDSNGLSSSPQFPGYWNNLVASKNKYQSRLSIAPSYVWYSMNSNSWVYGLLIYSYTFSATEVQQSINTDQSVSGLNPAAWSIGASLSANFQ